MARPNVSTEPQPDDTIILRGALQIEVARVGLQLAELNPELQTELSNSLQRARHLSEKGNVESIAINYTWFKIGEEVPSIKQEVLLGLGKLAKEGLDAGNDAALVLAAESLSKILSAK